MKFRPLGDRVVVRRVKEDQKTPGGIIIPDKWSGTEVKIDGEDLLIMKESDIMGILEGRPAAKKKAA
jgi:chaperonin GroES